VTFAITARTITVTVDAGQSKVYGNADPASYTYTHAGENAGETAAFTGALSRAAGENVGTYAINVGQTGSYPKNISVNYYDEAAGLPDEGIAPGTRWEDVPMNWTCPECGARKEDFEMVRI